MEFPEKLGGISHLVYFTSLQVIVYADRSLMAGLLPEAEMFFDFRDDDFAGGVLGSGFMGGFMVMSPFVAMASGKAATRTIGIGLTIWVLAELVTSLTSSYGTLLLARIVAGVGEAAFCALAPPMIDDTAPPSKRSLFVATYYSGVFIGMAVGFIGSSWFQDWATGRWAFLGLGACMIPYCVLILLFGNRFHVSSIGCARNCDVVASGATQTDVPLQGIPASTLATERYSYHAGFQAQMGGWKTKLQQVRTVLESGMYDFLVLGFAASQFVIGGFAYWALTYLENDLLLSKAVSSVALGLITVAAGILGSTGGGALFDRLTELAKTRWNQDEGVRGAVGCWVCTVLSVFVVPACCGTVLLKNGPAFLVCLGITQVLSFMGTAALMISTMEAVPTDLRGISMGMATFGGHLLGDLFSPTVVGKVSDTTGSLRNGVACLALWSVWCPMNWGAAYCLSLRRLGPVIDQSRSTESCVS